MPPARRTLTTAAVARVSAAMFALPAGECFGLEIEGPAHRREDVSARPSAEDIAWLERGTLPAGGPITLEPGGRGQLSPPPPPPPGPALPAAGVRHLTGHPRNAAGVLAFRPLPLPGLARDRPRAHGP